MKQITTIAIIMIVALVAAISLTEVVSGTDIAHPASHGRLMAARTGKLNRGQPGPRVGRAAETSVSGTVRTVAYGARRARNPIEEALRAAGAAGDPEFAIVTIDTQERGSLALVYQRSGQQWKSVRRFLQVGHPATIGSNVKVFGAVQPLGDSPADLSMEFVGVVVSPKAIVFYERDQDGERTPYYNQVADGSSVDQRVAFHKVALQGYCMRCRAMADRKDVQQVVLPNGRAASRGRCDDCGTIVFRTGQRSTELAPRLLAA